jgi:hypothetical protein
MAMSKEEKAVRDALAKFERDFAASTAAVNAMNQPASTNTPRRTATSKEYYNYYTGEYVSSPEDIRPRATPGSALEAEQRLAIPTGPTGPTGPTTVTTSTATLPATQQQSNVISGERRDAFQAIINALAPYNLEGLAGTVEQLMKDPNVGPSTAVYKLKFDTSINPTTGKPWNIAYQTRFPANVERINAGKPALSEAEYLSAERTYSQVLTSYGVGNLATKANFNKFISGDVSATEVADRVATAIDRVQNASAATKDALAQYYPKLNQLDIVTAVLDPTIGVPELKRKIQLAEIGGAATALGAGMTPEQRNRMILSEARAGELAATGVTGEQARRGYEAIGGFLQRGSQLADIYKQQPYTQQTAEAEIFGLQDSVMASQRRKKLTELETAQFGGKSGLTGGALQRDRSGQF